ncbi:MAG: M20/M25/M40 family metallo-hydrolase [Nitrospiraceae bacterium]|nr:M20/M25/M40 family metallo-hydrolase [Nitrospiraceae bacterium]
METNLVSQALARFTTSRNDLLQELKDLVSMPSVSFPGFDAKPVRSCAEAVAALLRTNGIEDVRMLDAGTGYPSVFGQWTQAPDMPTVLLYAHYDVQPVGREELWTTPPFRPAVRSNRLYGRGAADDKGGAMMHVAAISSFLRGPGRLPINVKVLIEGEEEVGSSNLEKLLKSHSDLLSADAVVIADSENFDTGHPSLTASLRGIVTVTVEVRSLGSSVHSGTWGGPLPDPVMALAKMIATLADDQGRPAIPGIMDRVRTLSGRDRQSMESLPAREEDFRKQSRLLEGVPIIGGPGTVYEKMWYRPSIAVNAFEASSRKQAANIVNDTAWARIGIRIVPDMDPQETLDMLRNHLVKQAPWGVQVDVRPESPSNWWRTDTSGPVFAAALQALEAGYGRKPAIVGAGGSIPFVRTITETLGGVPALLFGVGDPYSAAHSENESLDLSDWESACKSMIHFLGNLAKAAGKS